MRDIILVFVAGLTMVIFSLLFSGCVAVKPYERENLADRIMDFDAIAAESGMERHFLETREGSSGGHGGSGGGCACN